MFHIVGARVDCDYLELLIFISSIEQTFAPFHEIYLKWWTDFGISNILQSLGVQPKHFHQEKNGGFF